MTKIISNCTVFLSKSRATGMVAALGEEYTYHISCCYYGIITDRDYYMLHNYMHLPSSSSPR